MSKSKRIEFIKTLDHPDKGKWSVVRIAHELQLNQGNVYQILAGKDSHGKPAATHKVNTFTGQKTKTVIQKHREAISRLIKYYKLWSKELDG